MDPAGSYFPAQIAGARSPRVEPFSEQSSSIRWPVQLEHCNANVLIASNATSLPALRKLLLNKGNRRISSGFQYIIRLVKIFRRHTWLSELFVGTTKQHIIRGVVSCIIDGFRQQSYCIAGIRSFQEP